MKILRNVLLMIVMFMILPGFKVEPNTIIEGGEVASPERAEIETSKKTISGELSGFDCTVVGRLCPTTHRGADYTTGVFIEEEEFYFIVNIPQSFLQQYFRQTVEVQGEVYDGYEHAVEPEIIYLIDEGEQRLVYESGYFIDEEGNRVTFQDGVFKNDEWKVPE
jgi:hypothetical protein